MPASIPQKLKNKIPKKVRVISSTHTVGGRKTTDQWLSGPSLNAHVTSGHLEGRKRQGEGVERLLLKRHKTVESSWAACQSDADWETYQSDTELGLDDVLDGESLAPHSHAGSEFLDILLGEKEKKTTNAPRPRRDRVERQNAGFKEQLDEMVKAFMEWDAELGHGGLDSATPPAPADDGIVLQVVDVFRTFKLRVRVQDGTVASLIRLGLIPCAPFRPTVAVTTRVLLLFHSTHLRCPHLSSQAFVKGLCDLHLLNYRSYFLEQFTVCYDVYLQLKGEVQAKVEAALGREGNWRLRNACAACTYKLEDEPELLYTMLVTMDGNDSLKRVRRSKEEVVEEGPSAWTSTERPDSRQVSGDYYLTQDQVNCWASGSDVPLATQADGQGENNPCASRWANMDEAGTTRAFNVFDETGLFLSLCRHGYCLVLADMVRSGEMAKYPIAVVNELLNAFGSKIGGGYDIGCKFQTILNRSALGPRATELQYTPLVGSFHGHAHNRICQLSNLATYQQGLGLEDLEGCERFFSKSNALAASVRHASIFRRRQNISEYAKYMDSMETSQNLSRFLVQNYKQALEILADEPALKKAMEDNNIPHGGVFREWLKEEKEYLTSLKKEPEQETIELDYCQCLIDLAAARRKKDEIYATPIQYQPPSQVSTKGKEKATTSKPEKQRRDAEELWLVLVEKAQDLEHRLGITEQWTEQCDEFLNASIKLNRRHFQRCIDELEGLVVSRIFELTKMGMSQTGYKDRRNIAKALRARSQAVNAALKRYNNVARDMVPPQRPLSWSQVVNYTFLSEFDLLRDTRQDIRKKLWARPAGRMLMDRFFKIERAREEIQRVKVEIRRVITHLEDEDRYLRAKAQEVSARDPALGHQILRYHKVRTRFAQLHLTRFNKLASCPDFSGNITPGSSIDKSLLVAPDVLLARAEVVELEESAEGNNENDFEEEAAAEEAEEEAQFEALYAIAF